MIDTKHHQEYGYSYRGNRKKGYWYVYDPQFWAIFTDYKNTVGRDPLVHEVAAGDGFVSKMLGERGFANLSLSDIHDYRVDPVVKNLPFSKVDLNFDPLPFADNSVDIISAGNVVEHLENPFYFYREAFRVLKPGGVLIITMVVGWNVLSRLLFLRQNKIEGYHHPLHISFLPKDKFMEATRMFRLASSFYEQRREFYIFGIRIPWHFPRTERWSMRGCFVFEKPSASSHS